jgi:hypothetical protein
MTDATVLTEFPEADSPELDVTGIDIGTINLAFCRIRICGGQPRIIWWQVVDLLGLGGGIAREACANLSRCLKPFLPFFANCPLFAIEQQPSFNGPMKCVAHGLVAYLHTVSTNAQCETFMSAAQNKLRKFTGLGKETYDDRKITAIEILQTRLKEAIAAGSEKAEWLSWFESLKKKDDAADAWLHAFYALEKQQIKPYSSHKVKTISQLSTKELQQELSSRGLTKSGTKSDLKKRLKIAKDGEAGRSGLSPTELRAALAELGLPLEGTKVQLVKRLYQAQSMKKRKAKKM